MKPKPISKNIYFNLSFWGGLILASIASLVIACNNDLYWCFEIDCFSRFLIIFEFPIKIVSASFVVSGFVLLVHRSEQTRHQIEISATQNIFKNFIDHKKEFSELIASMQLDFPVTIKDKSSLYENLFPNNNTQNVEFTSTGKNGERSDLSFFIENHNELISQYNTIITKLSYGASLPIQPFARWLPEYLVFSMKLNLQFDELEDINPDWHGFLSPEVFKKGIPFDIEGFLYSCERVLNELSRFCFPDESGNIFIDSRLNSSHVKRLMKVYCEKKSKA